MAGPVLSSWCTLSPTILTTTTWSSKYYHLQMRERGEAWAWGGQSECLAGQLQTNASPHPTGRQHSQYNTAVFILLCPNLDTQILKIDSKAPWPRENFPLFLKGQRLCAASSVHAGRLHPAYREPAEPVAQPLQECPPTWLPPRQRPHPAQRLWMWSWRLGLSCSPW